VVIDPASWRVLRKKRLQSGGQFFGDYSFSADGTCWVARPYSGDVIELNERLGTERVSKLGRQPHEAIALPNGDIVARDWKTGDLLTGRMTRKEWWRFWGA